MKSLLASLLLIVTIAVIGLVAYLYQPSSRIVVANLGADVIEVKTDIAGSTTRLGQNGTGYFDSDARIQIGDAMISLDRRMEVINTGSDVIHIAYHDTTGREQTMMLGQGGSGHFSKATTISMGEVSIRVINSP